ncbi:hypothetical protein ACJRO7_031063 [Eucalyptus globulus]|uniref:Cytochrome P450 n=1 Tax=Eucalyptus globulus TaxID=34317 RepID=A0ABD3JGV8_EUCGL
MSSQDCTIGGYNVPRHTTVFINAWTIHRDRKLWDDPTSFKPERFENEDNGNTNTCHLGLGVITVTLGSLIQCFEWKRISEELVDMTEGEGMNMPKVVSLEAMCKPRKIMARIAEH